MKLVLTLLVRDEDDVLESNLRYHLERGVDFVIATDNGSCDATPEILARHQREGHLHVISEPEHSFDQGAWVTRMARMAATDFGADWIIHGDADEFFVSDRGGSLKDVLAEIPAAYGVVTTPRFNFLPPAARTSFFAEDMTVRETGLRKRVEKPKIAHRADPDVRIPYGCHRIQATELRELGGWYPIETLHFPIRSCEQWEAKIARGATAHRAAQPEEWERNVRQAEPPSPPRPGRVVNQAKAYRLWEHGLLRDAYSALVPSSKKIAAGIEKGDLIVDRRVRRALRSLGLSPVGPLALVGAESEREADAGAHAAEICAVADDIDHAAEAGATANGEVADRQALISRAAAASEQQMRVLRSEIKSLERKLERQEGRRAKAERKLEAVQQEDGRGRLRSLDSPARTGALSRINSMRERLSTS